MQTPNTKPKIPPSSIRILRTVRPSTLSTQPSVPLLLLYSTYAVATCDNMRHLVCLCQSIIMKPLSSRPLSILFHILVILKALSSVSSFSKSPKISSSLSRRGSPVIIAYDAYKTASPRHLSIVPSHRHYAPTANHHRILKLTLDENSSSFDVHVQRRQILQWPVAAILLSTMTLPTQSTLAVSTMEIQSSRFYVDPQGFFSLRIPKRFFVIRRESNGDDGSSSSILLTAGDLSKAQLISIERFSIAQFLQQQAGITSESLFNNNNNKNNNNNAKSSPFTVLSNIASPQVLVQLLIQRREKDNKQQGLSTRVIPNSIQVSPDDLSMTFQLATEIPVQKPELLMEQYGVNQLIRVTLGKVSISRGDGTLMVIYASGLQQDLKLMNGDGTWKEDGLALWESVQSFVPII